MLSSDWIVVYQFLLKSFPQDKDLWLEYINFHSATEKEILLTVPNNLYKDRIYDKYEKTIKNCIDAHLGYSLNIKVLIKEENDNVLSLPLVNETINNKNISKSAISVSQPNKSFLLKLNPKYTFEQFIVGPNSHLAYAAGLRIAEYPSSEYNPFFIYGGVGLGKTHLMQAIGHAIQKKISFMEVLYVTSEQFTNEYVYSLHKNRTHAFRLKYRYADLLLVDDIQFLEGKEGIQEELFHTFNMLKESGKQMVFTSDRSPKELKTITDRLLSRFSSGLVADIKTPNIQIRKVILRKKLSEHKINLAEDLIDFLASNITHSVRDLEACVLKIKSFITLLGEKITLSTVKNQLKDLLLFQSDIREPLSIEFIQREVANYYHINYSDIRSKKRTNPIAKARQIAVYLSKQLTTLSTTQLGYEFGGRNHSTMISSFHKIENAIEQNQRIRYDVECLKDRLLKV